MTVLDDEAWRRCWDFKQSAWRLETQQTYTMPDEQEDFTRFLAGEPHLPDDNEEQWHSQIRQWAAEGKSVSRVRLVRRPLTDYQRYIFSWGVPDNIEAGETVRVLDITDQEFGLPAQDFWMFDESTVVHLNFNPDGTFINAELVDEPDLSKYQRWQEVALKNSVPFDEWDARP